MNYFLGIQGSNRVLVADFEDKASGANHPVIGKTCICDALWHHAAATYDGSTWRLYVDGALDATLSVGAFTPRNDSIQRAAIGSAQDSAGTAAGFLKGAIDEVRIWNYARSATAIQTSRSCRRDFVAVGPASRAGGSMKAPEARRRIPPAAASHGSLKNGPAWIAGAPSLSGAVESGARCERGSGSIRDAAGNAQVFPDR